MMTLGRLSCHGADAFEHADSVEMRHDDVQNDDIGFLSSMRPKLFTVVGDSDKVNVLLLTQTFLHDIGESRLSSAMATLIASLIINIILPDQISGNTIRHIRYISLD
jgi:hypothetical protein